jgi:hypothetical protein
MQYDVKSPEEYLETLENDWRKVKLPEARRLIMQYGPELEESIKCKMLSYHMEQGDIFGLNVRWHTSV